MANFSPQFARVFRDKGLLLPPSMIWFTIVFIIAVALRCVAWSNTALMSPDGVLYIAQAKAIYYGQWDIIASCAGFRQLSIYPFFIAAVYNFSPDWVVAAKAINFVFGVATIVPLYLLLRQFFDYRISTAATLIVAVSPFFVSVSVDILRDPIYWFFLALGLYLFIARIKDDNRLFLLLSSLSFLLATWTRIESIVIYAISFGYVLCKDRDFKKIIIFLSPVIALIAIAIVVVHLMKSSINDLHRIDYVVSILSNSFSRYSELRSELRELEKGIDGQANEMLKLFLSEARMNMWLIALGMLINRVLETFVYILIIPSIFGFGKIKRIKEDPRLIYFLLLAATSLLTLYVFIMQKWVLEYRYVALFTLPSIVFAGVGLECIVKWFNARYKFKETLVLLFLVCMIVLSTLPKNMTHRNLDKIVFKEIGEFIVEREAGNHQQISVSAPVGIQRWVLFYANLNYQGAICHEPSAQTSWEIFAKQDSLIEQLKCRNIKYFLWTEKTWSAKNINVKKHIKFLKELRRWEHTDTGKMILYEVI